MRTKRFRWLYLAPALAIVALFAWSLASPIGASPDDDYHLVSLWCGDGIREGICEPGTSAASRLVPAALKDAAVCYAHHPDVSAACQKSTFTLGGAPDVVTDRGNFVGAYPPIYYAVMGTLASPNVLVSAIAMRMLNVLVFVGLTTGLFALLRPRRRSTLIWAWLVTTVPLGLFLIASNNPSAWAIIGVGSAWLALLGYFESSGRRRIGLAAVFVVASMMAAGSRSDAAIYAGLGIVAVLALTFARRKAYLLLAILPVVMGVILGVFFLTSGQSTSGLDGFGGSTGSTVSAPQPGATAPSDPLALIVANLFNIPSLWAGVLGFWGLGWFDTAMPAVVTFGAIACFVGVVFTGLSAMWWRKALVIGAIGIILLLLPAWVLYRGGDSVGQEVQPRYFLPLIVMFAGLAVLTYGSCIVRFTLVQRVLVTGTLSLAQLIALYVNMRRYVQGDGGGGWNLDQNPLWWWNIAVSPMFVLVIGSAAFAALVWILMDEASKLQEVELQTSTVDA